MPNHPWLEALSGDLARRGLPPYYVARFIQELDEHIEDLSREEEAMSTEVMEERLGSREELAAEAVAHFRHVRFSGRHPILMFLLAPVPALLLCWVLYFVLPVLACEYAPRLLGYDPFATPAAEWSPGIVAFVQSIRYASAYLPPAVAVLLWCWLARRSGRGWRWGLVSCLLIALVASLYTIRLELPTATARGSLMIGFGFPPFVWRQAAPFAVPQFAVPLLLGGWLLWRQGRAARRLRLSADP